MINRLQRSVITETPKSLRKKVWKLVFTLALSVVSIIVGISGYVLLEGYTFWDAFYMTIITISTVGFTEVEPLSETGRIFTSFFIIFNISIFAYIISVVTQYIFEGELQEILRNYMTNRGVKKLDNHVIVCGFGRNGSRACEELQKSNKPFVVIERNQEVIDHKLADQGYNFIEGDASDDDILKLAGIERASNIITALPKDADNVFITLTARELNPNINIIARATEESSESKLVRAGASCVVMPDNIGGSHMARLITKPEVIRFIDLISGVGQDMLEIDEVDYEDLKPEFRDKSIKEMDIRSRTGTTVIGYKHKDQDFEINPSPEVKVQQGDVLIILGSSADRAAFMEEYTS